MLPLNRKLTLESPRHILPKTPSFRGFRADATAIEDGFTLIELTVVIVILVLLAMFAAQRVDSIVLWNQRAEIRKFANTCEFLFNQALARREPYQLRINLDEGMYQAFREIPLSGDIVREVDRVSRFRLQSERKRRAERERERRERRRSLEDEFEAENLRQSGSLDELFFRYLFTDPEAELDLGTPLEFPSLADPVYFSHGVKVRDVRLADEIIENGEAVIRFSGRGASSFAVVHIEAMEGLIFTVFINPFTGELQVVDREIDFEWLVGEDSRRPRT